jgi:hypothetical protein
VARGNFDWLRNGCEGCGLGCATLFEKFENFLVDKPLLMPVLFAFVEAGTVHANYFTN